MNCTKKIFIMPENPWQNAKTEKEHISEMVRFGNYLLSKGRANSIENKTNKRVVTDADLENFKHLEQRKRDIENKISNLDKVVEVRLTEIAESYKSGEVISWDINTFMERIRKEKLNLESELNELK